MRRLRSNEAGTITVSDERNGCPQLACFMIDASMSATRYSYVRNVDNHDRYAIAPNMKKLRKMRLRWYDHLIRVSATLTSEIGLNIKVDGLIL